eukprot:gene10335-11438_t
MRKALLDVSLNYVHIHGWSKECLSLAALDLGLPPLAHPIASHGPVDMVTHLLAKKQHYVDSVMKATPPSSSSSSSSSSLDERRLIIAMESHFDFLQPYRERWPEALAVSMDPSALSTVLPSLLSTTNYLCDYGNIRASHLDWYSERLLLFFYYTSSELFFLTDDSDNLSDTKAFLVENLSNYRALRSSSDAICNIRKMILRF